MSSSAESFVVGSIATAAFRLDDQTVTMIQLAVAVVEGWELVGLSCLHSRC